MTDEPPVTEVEPITVIGQRYYGPWLPPSTGLPTPPVPGEVDELPGDEPAPEMQEDPDTRKRKDCAAQAYLEALEGLSRNRFEYMSMTHRRNGEGVFSHVPVPATGSNGIEFTQGDINGMTSTYGYTYADVMGVQHNHPSGFYCNGDTLSERRLQETFNAYPSVLDFNFAEQLVAGGADPFELTLYVVGCDGAMRSYQYANRAAIEAAREASDPPPDPMDEPDCEDSE